MIADQTDLARRRDKLGDGRLSWELTVGGEDISDSVLSVEANFPEDGASDAKIVADASLERYENARVSLRFGYGSLGYGEAAEWFAGELADPHDDHWGEGSEADAWGPFKAMAEQTLPSQKNYRGQSVEYSLYDLFRLGGHKIDRLEVRRGRDFVVGGGPGETDDGTAGIFPLGTVIEEAASSLCESAGFVLTDMPGDRRLAMPTPRPNAATEPGHVSYDEGHYPPGGFQAPQNRRNFYASVRVFRLAEDGRPAFPVVEVPVQTEGRYRPRPNRRYEVPDFLGGHRQALVHARELSAMLSRGTHACSLEGIAPNPDIGPYDRMRVETTEYRDEGGRTKEAYRVAYSFVVDAGVSVSMDREGHAMKAAGEGVMVFEKKLPKPFYVSGSPYVRRPFVPKGATLYPASNLYPADDLYPQQ